MYYAFSEKIGQPTDQYRVNDKGELETIYSPILTQSGQSRITHAYDKTWWSQVTNYPIKASLKIRGLLKPILLMSYLRVNVYFYGRKHMSSGVYLITK